VTDPGSGNESASSFVWLDTSTSDSEGCDFTDNEVSSYSTSALCIASGFEYSGMTNGQLLVEHWFFNGEKIAEYSYAWEWDETGLFGTYLPNGGDPMPAGSYYVELYAGDSLTFMGKSGQVTVEGDGGTTQPQTPVSGNTITVYGVVTDESTGKPINEAYVFVLTPGTTYDEWANTNYADKYIVSYLQTGANGSYRITDIPRDTEFTLVFSAQGYYDASLDNAVATDSDPDTLELNVGLTK